MENLPAKGQDWGDVKPQVRVYCQVVRRERRSVMAGWRVAGVV